MKRIIISYILLLSFFSLNAQEPVKKEFIRAILEADISFNYDEDYEKAAVMYESLLKNNPDNSNLSAKLGMCYLNIDGKKPDALNLLKKASKNIANNVKEYVPSGEKAPLDTYFYLAIAYHQNDSLEKAISLFNQVKRNLAGTESYREEYIDLQIRDCRYALAQKKKPLTIISTLFAPWLSEYPGACNPVLSKNDSVFVFTLRKDQQTQIYCSYKNGTWKKPVNITKQLGGFDRFYSNSITGDGRLLIIFLDDGGDGNLYYSQRNDTTWSKIKSVGKIINTIYWEAHGFITPDGNKMYFSSNRPGGEGELDIWTSDKAPDGTWVPPVNCGNVINTAYNENTPFFDPATSSLLFSSVGLMSMGGYDIFRSVFRNGGWTQPVGMPYAFNTSGENLFFILNNNAPGFVASRFDDKTNMRNIYSIVAIDPADEITSAAGTITLEDGMEVNPKLAQIKAVNIKTKSTIQNIPVNKDGSFKFDIKPGDYQIFVSHKGYVTDTINLNIPLYFLSHYLPVNSSLVPEKVTSGEFLSIKNVLFDFDSYTIKDEAKPTLEQLKNILINYPELTIEVAGYTDAIGGTEYNRKLADKRAQAIIDYFTSTGTSSSRFVKKSFGESNFTAVNTNPDGSDNPEGRKYNRRATFGIVDPQTGIIIRQETYTPEHLRQPYSMRYSIVLVKTKEKLYPGYFSGLIENDMLFLRTLKMDTVSMYILGVFYNKADAIKYLGYAREKGLNKAYIINQYDLENESKTILNPDAVKLSGNQVIEKVYTVQLKATRNPLNIDAIFNGLENVREIRAEDGFYKYLYGEYKLLSQAKVSLAKVIEMGYPDAFIRGINKVINK